MNADLKALPNRKGPRPQTEGPVPHRQISQLPHTNAYAKHLHEFVISLAGVANGSSQISDGGLSAFFLAEVVAEGWTAHFLIDNEFAHIHADPSHSLHLVLPHELGQILAAKGWAEQHPLGRAGTIPNTNFMLFGARDMAELEISKLIIQESWKFARQTDSPDVPVRKHRSEEKENAGRDKVGIERTTNMAELRCNDSRSETPSAGHGLEEP